MIIIPPNPKFPMVDAQRSPAAPMAQAALLPQSAPMPQTAPATQQNFLQSLLANPESAQFLIRLGAQLLQPIQPGSNPAGHIGSALAGSLDYLEGMRKNRLQEGLLGLDVRQKVEALANAPLERQALQQRVDLAGKQEDRLQEQVDLQRRMFDQSLAEKSAEAPVKALEFATAQANLTYAKARASQTRWEAEHAAELALAKFDSETDRLLAPFVAIPEMAKGIVEDRVARRKELAKLFSEGSSVAGKEEGDGPPPPGEETLPVPFNQLPPLVNRKAAVAGQWYKVNDHLAVRKREGDEENFDTWVEP